MLTKAQQNKTIKELKRLFDKWQWMVLDLGWQFQVKYEVDVENTNDNGYTNIMNVRADWGTLTAYIKVSVDVCRWLFDSYEEDDIGSSVEETIIHEFVHLLIDPLENDETDVGISEYVTTSISRIIHEVSKK